MVTEDGSEHGNRVTRYRVYPTSELWYPCARTYVCERAWTVHLTVCTSRRGEDARGRCHPARLCGCRPVRGAAVTGRLWVRGAAVTQGW